MRYTVGQLIKKLESFDPDMLVGAYNEAVEEAHLIYNFKIVDNSENHPYCKSDDVYEIYGIKSGTKVLLLIG